MKTTIGVTGATGHVGANLVRMLIEQGFQVRALLRNPSETHPKIPLEIVIGDLLDVDSLKHFCQGIEVVIHTAAVISIGDQPAESVYNTNVTGTKNLIEACRHEGVRRLIHFSSVDALITDCNDEIVDEETPLDVNSGQIYKRTKALGEQIALAAASDDFEVIVLAPSAIIGPYDFKTSLIGKMITRMYLGQLPVLVPGGYFWVDVRDVCQAAINAIHLGASGEKYLVIGQWASLVEIAGLVQIHTSKKVFVGMVPFWLAYLGVPFIKAWTALSKTQPLYTHDSLYILQKGCRNLSSAKATRVFGFNPRPLEETVTETIHWFKQNNYLV
ncbi:MAG: NAD-dependent epimerase/dehydratase family protein [Bacteroidales bacterium]|nr:NAD-dependent epimerase/dehydratase family protein [Bacteroidales bacterium]